MRSAVGEAPDVRHFERLGLREHGASRGVSIKRIEILDSIRTSVLNRGELSLARDRVSSWGDAEAVWVG